MSQCSTTTCKGTNLYAWMRAILLSWMSSQLQEITTTASPLTFSQWGLVSGDPFSLLHPMRSWVYPRDPTQFLCPKSNHKAGTDRSAGGGGDGEDYSKRPLLKVLSSSESELQTTWLQSKLLNYVAVDFKFWFNETKNSKSKSKKNPECQRWPLCQELDQELPSEILINLLQLKSTITKNCDSKISDTINKIVHNQF